MMSSPEINRPENEIDELLDEELDSDTEDPNIFRVRDPLPSPSANLLSTQALHSRSFQTSYMSPHVYSRL